MQNAPRIITILGTPVNAFQSMEDAVEFVSARIRSRQPTFCVAINPEKVYRAQRDSELRQALRSASVFLCDGVGISLASTLLHRKRLRRCTGVDLFMMLARTAAAEGWRVYLLGASPESNAAARSVLASAFPNLRIVGSQHGYIQNEATVLADINQSGADLLFVAMGSPRQEIWISKHLGQLNVTLCMGIGGSLDVLSGAVKRAPKLFQRTGTEWLFRLLGNPSRVRRQVALPLFAWAVLRAAVRQWQGAGEVLAER